MAGVTMTDVELAEHGPAMKRECVAWFKEPITGGVISEGIFNFVQYKKNEAIYTLNFLTYTTKSKVGD